MELFSNINKKKLEEIQHLQWALGIEHEMQVFHVPKTKENIRDFILFDSKSATNRVIKLYEEGKIELTNGEYEYLKNMVFETSGRVCNKKFVIKPSPYEMPEFITWDPFCNYRKQRFMYHLVNGARVVKRRFFDLLMKDPLTKSLVDKYGELSEYPFGMTRYMSVPHSIDNGKYKFLFNKNKQRIIRPDYTGSYHVTFTLPHDDKTTEKEFINMHINFANQIQWLEPLMLVGFFSGDEFAMGSKEDRVRGSFRVMIIGWGNLAGSDIRLFESKGIGRYAKTPNYWRKGLKLYESELLEPCIAPSPSALKELGITSLSSDLRTFGSKDKNRPEHRESGLPMNKPNGIEIRIFDNFDDLYLEYLVNYIGLIAENSRVTKTKGYVYEDKDWIDALHSIMKDGYMAELNSEYINKLRKKLGLKINTKSKNATQIFRTIYNELYEKNINGLWSTLFFSNSKSDKKLIKNEIETEPINIKSSYFSLFMKLNRHKDLMDSFNQLSVLINQKFEKEKIIKVDEFKKYILKLFNKNWIKNTYDFLYAYQFLGNIHFEYDTKDNISGFKKINKIPIYENFNEEIKYFFQQKMLNDE